MAETTDVNEGSSIEAVRWDIHRTQREMGETIREIQHRLSPKHLAQQTKESMGRAGVNIVDKIKHNPVGLVMAGVGLWLLFRSNDREEIESVSDRLKSKASDVMDSARTKASELAETASAKTEQVRSVVREKSRAASSQVEEFLRAQPLVAGLCALCAGALVGAVIPETKKEDELLGDKRDQLVDQASSIARERIGRAKEMAREQVSNIVQGA